MKNDPRYWFIVTMIIILAGWTVFFVGLFVAFSEIQELQRENITLLSSMDQMYKTMQHVVATDQKVLEAKK